MENTGTIGALDIESLGRELRALSIAHTQYSLGVPRNERMCIENSAVGWEVYFFERGMKSDLRIFHSFDDAKAHFIKMLCY